MLREGLRPRRRPQPKPSTQVPVPIETISRAPKRRLAPRPQRDLAGRLHELRQPVWRGLSDRLDDLRRGPPRRCQILHRDHSVHARRHLRVGPTVLQRRLPSQSSRDVSTTSSNPTGEVRQTASTTSINALERALTRPATSFPSLLYRGLKWTLRSLVEQGSRPSAEGSLRASRAGVSGALSWRAARVAAPTLRGLVAARSRRHRGRG